MAIIKWVDELLADWGGWMRRAGRERLGYQESVLGRLVKNPIVDHSAKRIGMPTDWTVLDDGMLEVSKAVSALDEKQRTVVFMHYVQRIPWSAVARALHCDETTAKRRNDAAHFALSCRLPKRAAA